MHNWVISFINAVIQLIRSVVVKSSKKLVLMMMNENFVFKCYKIHHIKNTVYYTF